MALDLSLLQTLAVRHDGGVWQVTLNRPEAHNAMSLAMVRELRLVLAEAEAHAGSRVLVLRGAGGHFCAGGDIQDLALARQRAAAAAEGDDTMAPMAEVSAAFGELCVAYAHTGLATIAVVEGSVPGGGFGLACVVDVCLAGAHAVFRLPETSLGIVPAQITAFLVERLGYSEAKRLAVTGGRLDARAALAPRLVLAVHGDAAALDTALAQLLHDILQCAPGAVAATQALLAKARLHSTESLVDEAAAVRAGRAWRRRPRRHAGLHPEAHTALGAGMSFTKIVLANRARSPAA
jgi:isohexenylglutaconyl-CoA hydratase